MQIEMYETELRKVADPADVDELLNGITTKQRIEKTLPTEKRRIVEIDSVLAANPKEIPQVSAWDTAVLGGDKYGGVEPRKELVEEHQHLTESVAFKEAALRDGRVRLDAVIGRISLPFCERERPGFVADIQIVVDSFEEALAAFKRLVARREGLRDKGFVTGSLPCFDAPEIVERIEMYFRWIRANYPEVRIP